jgi:hypothetical protein
MAPEAERPLDVSAETEAGREIIKRMEEAEKLSAVQKKGG